MLMADDKARQRSVRTLLQLRADLRELAERDSEQEVTGIAVPALHSVIEEAKTFLEEDDPVVDQIANVISPESVIAGSIRCVDALLVVNMLVSRISKPASPRTVVPKGSIFGDITRRDF